MVIVCRLNFQWRVATAMTATLTRPARTIPRITAVAPSQSSATQPRPMPSIVTR